MKNKIISILTIFVLILVCMCNTLSYAVLSDIYCGNLRLIKRYGYTTMDGEYWISGVLSPTTTTEIKVPGVADDNLEITAIYDNTKTRGVFQSSVCLRKVDLSDSKIRLIGTNCFKDCIYLTDFENGKYLTEISGYAFQGANLNGMTLNDGLEKIQISAFEDAFSDEKKIHVIDIPDTVTTIGKDAFKVTEKNYRVVLVGKKDSIVENYCETDSTCTFMERGDKIPTEEEILQEEIRKEKSKIFENPKFSFRGYNNTDSANVYRYFGLPASTLKSSNSEEYKDIIVVDDGLIVVGHSYIDRYKSDSKYIQETFLSKAKGNDDGIIVKYDYDLNMQYFESFGGSLDDEFEKIYKTKDGGYLVFGKTTSYDKDLLNINDDRSHYKNIAVKYDKNFKIESVKIGSDSYYENNKDEILEDEKGKISDGEIKLNTISNGQVGVVTGVAGYEMDAIITKYDENGYKEWTKIFDRDSNKTNDSLTKVVEIDDGYIFIGASFTSTRSSSLQGITETFLEDAIIAKYKRPYNQILINGMQPYKINIGEEKSTELYYVPWEDVTIGEMNWTSENEEVATVDYKGNITGISEGETKIHLNIRGKTAEIYVEVNNPALKHIENIELNKSELILEKGTTEILISTIEPMDTTDSKIINWTSNNTSIVTVDSNGKIAAVSEGTATITATSSNGKTATCTVTVTNPAPVVVPITGVTLNETKLDFSNKNQTFTLEATITPNNTTQSKTVTWSSSNTNVATVDENGKVTSKSAGTTVITATTSNGLIATCRVNIIVPVIPTTNVNLNKTNIKIEEGKIETLIATILPENHTDSSQVTWSSSNINVATVDENGKVTAVLAGTATITATSSNGKTATCTVTVTNPAPVVVPITEVTLNETKLDFSNKNQTFTLEATITPNNTTQSKTVTWSSSNTNVATVDENGKVTAVSAGTTVITATTSNGLIATCRVNIIVPVIPTTNVNLNKTNIKIEEGNTETLIATILPENHTDSSQVTWSSSNINVATVDENGKVTAVLAGTATITATSSNGKTATCTVTVTNPKVEEPENPKPEDPDKPSTVKLGDVNKDGNIDVFDARVILRKAASRQEFTEYEKQAGDVNKDGQVNVLDARKILMYAAKIITKFE